MSIVFKNKGSLDPRAIKTMGVSVKKEDAIGFFGTGLKYAIAILLRDGQEVCIYSNGTEYRFDTIKAVISGKEFYIVRMNGEELGFTTELGKTWHMWQAFREIYCNCADEGGETSYERDGLWFKKDKQANDNETVVVVSGDKFEQIYRDRSQYFIEGSADFITPRVDIHRRKSDAIFYKGVRIFMPQEGCLYAYNITGKIDLTEDRTAKYYHQLRNEISYAVTRLTDRAVIKEIVCAPEMYFESDLDYNVQSEPSEDFLDVCNQLAKNSHSGLNAYAAKLAKKYTEKEAGSEEITLDNIQREMLDKCMRMLDAGGFNVDKYPIVFVKSLGTNCFGRAANGKI